MYHNILRATLTVVMLMFILMGAHAVISLGFGWWGVGIPILMAVAVLWEIWIQPGRDEAYRQELLAEIEGMTFEEPERPYNIHQAKETIEDLQCKLSVVTGAYIDLKENEREEECSD